MTSLYQFCYGGVRSENSGWVSCYHDELVSRVALSVLAQAEWFEVREDHVWWSTVDRLAFRECYHSVECLEYLT